MLGDEHTDTDDCEMWANGMSQSINLQLDLTTDDGLAVPVKVDIEYPEHQGLWVIKALRKAFIDDEERTFSGLINLLVEQGDGSVVGAIMDPRFGKPSEALADPRETKD